MPTRNTGLPNRPTESPRSFSSPVKMLETRAQRNRGRPAGSKNKPKGLIPAELAGSLLLQMKDMLPPEHYEYIRGVVRDGKAVSAKHEAQIMLLMLGRNLLPALLAEMKPSANVDSEIAEELGVDRNAVSMPEFRRDVNERLKVWASILNLVMQAEKRDDEGADTKTKPIIEIFARRGVDGGRIKLLAGYESGSVGGDPDGTGGEAGSIGTISVPLPERPLSLSSGGEVEASWAIDGSGVGDDPRGLHEA